MPLGAASVTFAAGVNSSLQLAVEPAMRGRVMSLYSVVFLGSTPIGAPLVGWLAEVAGPRSGLLAGAVAAGLAAVLARVAFARASAGDAAHDDDLLAEGALVGAGDGLLRRTEHDRPLAEREAATSAGLRGRERPAALSLDRCTIAPGAHGSSPRSSRSPRRGSSPCCWAARCRGPAR